jgi:hypothetical protein
MFYDLNMWSTTILEKLKVVQMVKELSLFIGSERVLGMPQEDRIFSEECKLSFPTVQTIFVRILCVNENTIRIVRQHTIFNY